MSDNSQASHSKQRGNLCFVCFGGQDWWYHNRGHIDFQIMKRFARKGTTLYVNSIVMQKPNFSREGRFIKKLIRKSKSVFRGFRKTEAGFWVYSPFTLPVHHLNWARPLNEVLLRFQVSFVAWFLGIRKPIVWVACPAACDTALKMKKSNLVYQRTDLYEAFPNVDSKIIREYDQKLKAQSDLTVFVNRILYSSEKKECKEALFLDHGVDFEMFASENSETTDPIDINDIKKPIVGFFGTIDGHTVDIEFTGSVIDLLPDLSFVFIGSVSHQYPELQNKANVWMLGQKPYEQIPNYGRCFDVSIMIWRQTKWIQSCNPIKLKEYLALGKPVVSTPFPELQKYLDVVYEADSPEGFAECIRKALAEDGPERIAARRKKVETATWDSKAELVLEKIFGLRNDQHRAN